MSHYITGLSDVFSREIREVGVYLDALSAVLPREIP